MRISSISAFGLLLCRRRFDKRWAYEESLKMPLIIRWPGKVKPGTRCAAIGVGMTSNRALCSTYGRTAHVHDCPQAACTPIGRLRLTS
ncbi:MAG: sulfatase/phosphatase domain-containing protein [Fuerstiella sp.]